MIFLGVKGVKGVKELSQMFLRLISMLVTIGLTP